MIFPAQFWILLFLQQRLLHDDWWIPHHSDWQFRFDKVSEFMYYHSNHLIMMGFWRRKFNYFYSCLKVNLEWKPFRELYRLGRPQPFMKMNLKRCPSPRLPWLYIVLAEKLRHSRLAGALVLYGSACFLCSGVFAPSCPSCQPRNAECRLPETARERRADRADRGNMRSCQEWADLLSGILIHGFICIRAQALHLMIQQKILPTHLAESK